MFIYDEYESKFVHIYNRGVDKRNIFTDDSDRRRFLAGLQRFNEGFVDINAFCLMSNHYHLLVEERMDKGVSQFMQRLGTGYMMYFNKRHERSGRLFESKYKSVPVVHEAHFLHISRYIHLNPIDMVLNSFIINNLFTCDRVQQFLEGYEWSSYQHYLGIKTFDFIKSDRILDCFDGPDDYKKFVLDWLRPEGQGQTLNG